MEAGKYYHIYNRTNNNELLFREDENYLFFLGKYKQYLNNFVDTYAYCLMPTHFHLLIRIKEKETETGLITLAFKNFFISYAKSFNEKYSRKGSLFQPKFKKKSIDKEDYLTRVIFYIHANPIVGKCCERIEDWPYSSYNAIISESPTTIKRKEVLDWFNGKDDFKRFHHELLSENY